MLLDLLVPGAPARTALVSGRFECKYFVSPLLLSSIRQFVRSFAEVDPLAATAPDLRYSICSLYLDTDDLLFYRQYLGGERSRFKLRARTYCDDPEAPVFLEVKSRINRLVSKQRAVLSRDRACSLLEGRGAGRGLARKPRGLDAFATDLALTSARPVVRVKYRREAYVSPGPQPARVTFDTDVRFQPTFGPTLAHEGGRWTPLPLDEVVVEVKYTESFPLWIENMIRTFSLVQRPCCKYALSIERMISNGGAAALCLAGFTAPPMALRRAS
jgi:hypothetical protein